MPSIRCASPSLLFGRSNPGSNPRGVAASSASLLRSSGDACVKGTPTSVGGGVLVGMGGERKRGCALLARELARGVSGSSPPGLAASDLRLGACISMQSN